MKNTDDKRYRENRQEKALSIKLDTNNEQINNQERERKTYIKKIIMKKHVNS